MKNSLFQVTVEDFESLQEVEGAWPPAALRALLKSFNFTEADEMPENELKEMVVMSLQDLEPAEAAEALLEHEVPQRVDARSKNPNVTRNDVRETVGRVLGPQPS